MKLRKVDASDLHSFIKLYQEAYRGLEEYAYGKERDIKRYFKWLLSRDKEGFFTVDVGEPIGFVACDANWFSHIEHQVMGEIHELFVHPNYRGRGVGSQLLKSAIEHAEKRERKTVGLWVGVENYEAKRFYSRFGFNETLTLGIWTRMIKRLK